MYSFRDQIKKILAEILENSKYISEGTLGGFSKILGNPPKVSSEIYLESSRISAKIFLICPVIPQDVLSEIASQNFP